MYKLCCALGLHSICGLCVSYSSRRRGEAGLKGSTGPLLAAGCVGEARATFQQSNSVDHHCMRATDGGRERVLDRNRPMLRWLSDRGAVDESGAAGVMRSLPIPLGSCSYGRRIAVFGGSFDPPTTGHLRVACEIINLRAADEVWLVPCGVRPDKPSLRTAYMHRLTMCHLAVSALGAHYPIRVCDVEMLEPCALATFHVMERLKQLYPDRHISFLIGADLISSLKQWGAPGVPDAGERLWRECSFLVMPRPGYELPADLPANFTPLQGTSAGAEVITDNSSSSEVRKRLAHGSHDLVEGLLAPAVLSHVVRYGLYAAAPVAGLDRRREPEDSIFAA